MSFLPGKYELYVIFTFVESWVALDLEVECYISD